MANINISDGSTYTVGVTDPSWVGADGDQIIISNESEVLIDADQYVPSNKWGNITNSTIGTFRIKNAGTNGRMLVFEMNAISNNIRMERSGIMITEGDFLEVATGDGTSGQTIDFSSVGTNGVSLDVVETIWIEETPGGKKWPFLSLGDPSVDRHSMPLAGVSGSEGTGASGFGGAGASSDWAVGRNFNFNRTTKVATFGDGTNGLVIPNGCKAYINNIQITGTYDSTYQNRSEFDLSPEGSVEFTNTEITSSLYCRFQNFTKVVLNYVSCTARLYIRDAYDNSTFNNLAVNTDTRRGTDYYPEFSYETPLGGKGTTWTNIYFNVNLRGNSSNRYGSYFFLQDASTFENVYGIMLDNDSVDYLGAWYYANGIDMKNVYLVGYVNLAHYNDVNIIDWKWRGTPFAPAFTSTSQGANWRNYGVRLTGINSNVKFINFQHVPGSTPPQYLIDANDQTNGVEIYNAIMDSEFNGISNWSTQAIRTYADNTIIKNCQFDGYYTSYIIGNELEAQGGDYDNIYTDTGRRMYGGLGNFKANMVDNGGLNEALIGLPSNVGIILTRSVENNIGTAPNIQYGGFIKMDGGGPVNNSYEFEKGGGAYLANGDWYLPNIGSYVGMGNKQPLRGFKGFLDVANGSRLSVSGLSLQNLNFYYKMSLADDSLPTTWTQINITETGAFFNAYTYLQTPFNAIKGANYDSNKGINFAFKIENANNPNPSRIFYFLNLLCEVDNDYVANDASITFEGGDTTTKYEIVRASDNVVLYSFIGTGTHDFYLSNNYRVEVYFKRYRYVTGGYDLLLNTQYTSQALDYGFNGNIKLYAGTEVQVASTDIQAIWEYTNRTLTEGFTASDREQLNKALTTGKFLALK